MEDFIKTVNFRAIKNGSIFITKDLPVGFSELKDEIGGGDLIGIDDEIEHMLKKSDFGMWMKDRMVHSDDIYRAICSKKLYEHALHVGGYSIPKTAASLLTRNNFVEPEAISLSRLKSGKRINTMLLTWTQRVKMYKKLVRCYPGNGLALLLSCSKNMSIVIPEELTLRG